MKHSLVSKPYWLATKSGMTLVELIVVVGIMVVLTGVLVGYSRQSRDQILLTAEQAKIIQTIARARSLTLAGYTKPVSLPPPCSYGFGISNRDYFIFQYSPQNCQIVGSLPRDVDNNPPFKITERSTLPIGLNFNQKADSLKYLLFIPPNLNTILFKTPSDLSPDPLSVYLRTDDQSLEKPITVGLNGQVSL